MRWLRFAGGGWDRMVAFVFSDKLSFLLANFSVLVGGFHEMDSF